MNKNISTLPNYRFKHIDSLRGIAVLLVIWLHVSEVYINLSPTVKAHGTFLYDFAWYINTGRIGVVIFFAISGFVLLKSIKGRRAKATKTFLIRRFFRLYPAFWISVLLGFYTMVLMGKNISFGTIVANLTMLPQVFNQDMILGLYWTLETELFFYFIGWLLFVFGKLHKPINLFIISLSFLGIFIVLRIYNFSNVQHVGLVSMPLFLSIMFWGGLFRNFYDNPKLKINIFDKKVPIKFLVSALTITILFPLMGSLVIGIVNDEFKYLQNGLSNSIGIILFLILSNTIKIKNKFIVWIGTISYSMYLFHPIVFYTLLWWLKNYAPTILTELNLIVYLIVNFVLSIAFSSIIYYLVEKPSINFSHNLTSYK